MTYVHYPIFRKSIDNSQDLLEDVPESPFDDNPHSPLDSSWLGDLSGTSPDSLGHPGSLLDDGSLKDNFHDSLSDDSPRSLLDGIPRSSCPVDSLSDTPLDHCSLDDLVASGEDLSEAESEPI